MTNKRAPAPTPRITRQSTASEVSERDRALRDHALFAASQARHRETQLNTKRRECCRAHAETEKVREDRRADQLAAIARLEVDKQEFYDMMQSAEDVHERDVSGLHTLIRMDEEAKYYLSRAIADLHRRLEGKMTTRKRERENASACMTSHLVSALAAISSCSGETRRTLFTTVEL
jgi:hypothetical protein